MEYQELFRKYLRLLEENQNMKVEIQDLRRKLNMKVADSIVNDENDMEILSDSSIIQNHTHAIDNTSKPEDKIKLFMALFRGRTDVYAKRWVNKKGVPGYSPVCINLFRKGLCLKPKESCTACKNKAYAPMTPEIIGAHLQGKNIIGLYPMLKDDCCNLLAIDFDGDKWQKDVSIIQKITGLHNIPLAVERSRSGNGAHVWFFFQEKISAAKARKFGAALITKAMLLRHELSFSSYDRMFPNQDTLRDDGLGNLIALPLQQEARQNANSVFIDNNYQPYQDQWTYLSNIRKITQAELESYIAELVDDSELGTLRSRESEDSRPWEKSKAKQTLSKSDFPDTARVTMSNMIYLEKSGFSQKALNAIKRFAAFQNPEFYKAQALRLNTYKIPRIISLADDQNNYLALPRGCNEELDSLFADYGIPIEWNDQTYSGKNIDIIFNGALRMEQIDACEALLSNNFGVLSASTGFGKTVIAAQIIASKKVNTLVLLHLKQLLFQWKEKLSYFLTINENLYEENLKSPGQKKVQEKIGQIGGGKNNPTGIIDLALMQSLVKGTVVKDIIDDYGMIIIDECHHIPAFSFESILKKAQAKYVYGLSATPIRRDGHHPIIFMQCGPIRYKVDDMQQAEKRPFEHFIIPRFTPFRPPVHKNEKSMMLYEIYKEICTSEIRNNMIVNDVEKVVKDGRNPLILSERTEHVTLLADKLRKTLPNVVTLTGSMSAKERKAALNVLDSPTTEGPLVIVATGRYIGEGFDEPRLDTLFLAMPVSWKGIIQQYAGRLHRLSDNKKDVQIYDYVDFHVGVLERMYYKRLKGYASIGYSIKAEGEDKLRDNINTILDYQNFIPLFRDDVQSANKEIFISSPVIGIKQFALYLDILSKAIQRGVGVTLITQSEIKYKKEIHIAIKEMHEALFKAGIDLILDNNSDHKFAVIDRKITWYGSINLLSSGYTKDIVMRLENWDIADELITVGLQK